MTERTGTRAEHRPDEEPVDGQAASAASADVDSLGKRAQAAEADRDNYLALLQRCRADFENYRKRFQRDLAEARRDAAAAFARDMLPVLDNLQRALDAALPSHRDDPFTQGVALVRSQFLDVLRRAGITAFDPSGEPFDPAWHEAVREQYQPDIAAGTVIEVLEPGFRLPGRVLRPAKVVVSAAAGN